MRRFTQLYLSLDATSRTNEKVAALKEYFLHAPESDAAWATWFLTGHRPKRAITTTQLREIVANATQLPLWLVEESYDMVGDLGETLALLLDTSGVSTKQACALSLTQLVTERLLPLSSLPPARARLLLEQTWRELSLSDCFLFLKMITGNFRVGAARTLLTRALAEAAELERPVMAHRLMGQFQPTVEDYRRLMASHSTLDDISHPYPFFLAYQLDRKPESLGKIADWQIEWKWDGVRAQLIKRRGQSLIWSRGEDLITGAFPEICNAMELLPDGTVLDGELLAWKQSQPLPFSVLQHRLGRKTPSPRTCLRYPVSFMAYDLLEEGGVDVRSMPLAIRRMRLQALVESLALHLDRARKNQPAAVQTDLFEPTRSSHPASIPLILSPVLDLDSWQQVDSEVRRSRESGVEGVMLKRQESLYGLGREKGQWWKWKVDPLTIDAVLVAAQQGHGRRASLYTDYTFAVWENGALVTVAKAYSGLTDAEIEEVDKFVRAHTEERHGPIRTVKPQLVFELAFEGIQSSTRHKSGIALRFPRINRRRQDKQTEEADTLEHLKALIKTEFPK